MNGQERIAKARQRIVPAVTCLVERAQRDGHRRADAVAEDMPIIELMVNAVAATMGRPAPDPWRRCLAIIVDGLSARRTPLAALANAPTREVVEGVLICQRSR
jgi:hypothetical protein